MNADAAVVCNICHDNIDNIIAHMESAHPGCGTLIDRLYCGGVMIGIKT